MPTLLLKFEQNLYESDDDLRSEMKRVEDFLQVTGWKIFPSTSLPADERKKENQVIHSKHGKPSQFVSFYRVIYVKRTDKFVQAELTTSDVRIASDANHTS